MEEDKKLKEICDKLTDDELDYLVHVIIDILIAKIKFDILHSEDK